LVLFLRLILSDFSERTQRLNKTQSSNDEIKFGHPMTVILFGVDSTIEQKPRSSDEIISGHPMIVILFGVDSLFNRKTEL